MCFNIKSACASLRNAFVISRQLAAASEASAELGRSGASGDTEKGDWSLLFLWPGGSEERVGNEKK